MSDISHITNKFYKNEEERLRKLLQKQDIIKQVGTILEKMILRLYAWKIRFFVFETIEDANPPIMYAGLKYCCNQSKSGEVDILIRNEVEAEIINKTPYKKIIWEM